MQSISRTFAGLVVPAWWPWVAGLLSVLLSGMLQPVETHAILRQLTEGLALAEYFPDEVFVVPLILGILCLLILARSLASTRRGAPPETAIYRDRLEMFDRKTRLVVFWKDIVIQDATQEDVWEEFIGRGETRHSVIRLDVVRGMRRAPVRLYFHLNPLGRLAPNYLNEAALKREFLLAMLRARPELRIASTIYASCEIDSLTLQHSRYEKYFFAIASGIFVVALLAVSYYTLAHILLAPSAWKLIGGILAALLITTLVFAMIMGALEKRLFVAPQDPRAIARRRALLGAPTVKPPLAANYPLLETDDGSVDLKHSAPRPGRDWYEALVAGRREPADCPWELLNGDDWYLLLEARPDLASHCDWTLLDGEAWSMLLPEHPEWASRCDWQKLDSGNWADLISAAPQFDESCFRHIQWSDFAGEDWATLLAGRPELLSHCDLSRLDADNWEYILLFQPALARHCPLKNFSDAQQKS
ncbi:MAG: hypothetical protein WAV95_07000 [Azonexus sp.]